MNIVSYKNHVFIASISGNTFHNFQSPQIPVHQTPRSRRILRTQEFDNLHLGSYKKLKSPIFYTTPIARNSDKENLRPETPTVTMSQKKKRRSSISTPSSIRINMSRTSVKSSIFPAVFGQGRSIPLKQGLLSKKSYHSWMSGEWVPKYVTLTGEGLLVYYPSLSDYLDSAGGKEIRLHTATVRIPGQNPDGVQCGVVVDKGEDHEDGETLNIKSDTHSDRNIFEIISLSQQRWTFECNSPEERDEWVRILGSEIKACLQGPCSGVEGDVLSRVLC
jgi:hypothetical protein